jgi:inorganic pyrophosphatase
LGKLSILAQGLKLRENVISKHIINLIREITKMDIQKIAIGKNPPHEVNVIIEVPVGSDPVKYELDKDSGALFVDRFLHTAMHYPCNYGFIPHTLSDDGDPIDALVITRRPITPGAVIAVRPIGVLLMEDESGGDEKLLAVPASRLHPFYDDVQSYEQLPQILLDQISHFFAHYKDLEPNKWVKIVGWRNADAAKAAVESAIALYNEKNKR